MMQAGKRKTLSQRQWVVFSKACAQTWMGECVFRVWVLSLTLDKVWLRPCVHCQLSQKSDGGISHTEQGHTTTQTTGLGGHMAARFIPTIDRGSIDLV